MRITFKTKYKKTSAAGIHLLGKATQDTMAELPWQ
jgi:hypothetical protein